MSKASRRAAALRAAPLTAAKRADARRADTRAATLADLGHAASAYAGLTPTTIDGRPVMHSNGIGWGVRSREQRGTTIRAGKKGGLKLVRPRYDAGAPKRGGAHLAAGEFLTRDGAGATRVAFTAHIEHPVAPDATPAMRAALSERVTVKREGGAIERLPAPARAVIVLRGEDDAPPPPDDTGDTDADIATAAYYTRLRIERGDIRPSDIDPATGHIKEV